MNASASRAAVIKAIGSPFMALGVSAISSYSLIPDIIIRTRVNPIPPPSALAILSRIV